MSDEIGIHNDMDKPVRMGYAVTAKRVEHYDDVVGYMTKAAVDRYVKKHKVMPSMRAVVVAKREIARLAIIVRDVVGAEKVEIPGYHQVK